MCEATVWEGMARYNCSRKGVVEVNGKMYCRQHATKLLERVEGTPEWEEKRRTQAAERSYEKRSQLYAEIGEQTNAARKRAGQMAIDIGADKLVKIADVLMTCGESEMAETVRILSHLVGHGAAAIALAEQKYEEYIHSA